jgi:hypothetical protein
MTFAEAFFDESGTNDDEKNLCLGGYVFTVEASAAFEAGWRDMLQRYGLRYFHMREFRQKDKGVFQHLSLEQREASLQEAITIIEKHATCGFAFSVEKRAFGDVALDSPWSKEYSFLANQTFYGIEETFRSSAAGAVNYVFEQGAEGWGEAEAVYKQAKARPGLEAKYRLGQFRRETKESAVQLQAADLLVWSTLRSRRLVDEGGKLGSAPELRRLMGVRLHPHHWDRAAGEMIQWVRTGLGTDVAFLEWLQTGNNTEFLRWLKHAGPVAVDYFRAIFRNVR